MLYIFVALLHHNSLNWVQLQDGIKPMRQSVIVFNLFISLLQHLSNSQNWKQIIVRCIRVMLLFYHDGRF